MADTTARIVLSAEDKTGAALASLRNGLSGVTSQATQLQSVFTRLVPALTFAGAATFVKGINDGVDALNDLKDATGASISNISALEDIGVRTGTSFDTVSTSLVKFNQVLADSAKNPEVAAAFKAINLNAEELKKLDPAEALRRTAVALDGFADDGNKARLVQELFGRSIKEVAPFLKDLATQTQLVGKVTEEQANEAERFNKILFELQKNTTDAARAFTADLIPALSNLSKEFSLGVKSAGGFFNAVTTLGTINPFRTQAENIRAYSEELRELEQTRTDYLERGFSTAAIDADIADVRTKLAYLKQLQQDAALAGSDANQSGAESRRLGIGARGARSVGSFGAGSEESAKKLKELNDKIRAQDSDAWQKYYDDLQAMVEDSDDAKRKSAMEARTQILSAEREQQRQYFEWIDEQREEDDRKAREAAGIFDGQSQKVKEVSDAARELGFTFSSAFEDAVIGGEKTRVVLQGLLQDAARIGLRKSITEPLANKISGIDFGNVFSGLFGGGGGSSIPIDGYAGGGYTGGASRSGGLDGQGGFLAMLHPQETVVDHTVPMANGGGMQPLNINYVTHIDSRTDRREVAEMVERVNRNNNAQLIDRLQRQGRL